MSTICFALPPLLSMCYLFSFPHAYACACDTRLGVASEFEGMDAEAGAGNWQLRVGMDSSQARSAMGGNKNRGSTAQHRQGWHVHAYASYHSVLSYISYMFSLSLILFLYPSHHHVLDSIYITPHTYMCHVTLHSSHDHISSYLLHTYTSFYIYIIIHIDIHIHTNTSHKTITITIMDALATRISNKHKVRAINMYLLLLHVMHM